MPRAVAVAALAALAVAASAAGCDDPPRGDGTLRPTWAPLTLPAPPGEPGRLMLRDAAACAGRWYVVGAVTTAAGETRPAAWGSDDASTWRPIRMAPSSYYGHRSILYAVGCHAGRIAVIGAKAGGAHGNPRVRTWRQAPDGSLVEVPAEFLVYGGPAAVNVSRIAGGPGGWLIAGGRTGGAAVWRSPDAANFQLVEGAPQLASDAAVSTSASDVIAVADGWLVGGSGRAAGLPYRDPLVWTSADGLSWTRVALSPTVEDEVVQRLADVGGGWLAVGVRGDTFGAWRLDGRGGSGWRPAGRFGVVGGGAVAGVEALASAGGRVLAITVAAEGHRLWSSDASGDRWTPVALPVQLPAGGDTAASVAAMGERAVLVADDGQRPGAWLTTLP